MERLAVGDIVVTIFPFSDLKGHKKRPALILAKAEFGKLITCQITSKPYSSKTAVKLIKLDFLEGSLPITSFIRPDKLFTAESSIILRRAGRIKKDKLDKALLILQKLFKN